MQLTVGTPVILRRFGLCKVTGTSVLAAGGKNVTIYEITPEVGPKQHIPEVALGPMLVEPISQARARDLLETLAQPRKSTLTWNRRYREHSGAINGSYKDSSGRMVYVDATIEQCAHALRELIDLPKDGHELSYGERALIEQGKHSVAAMLSVALGCTRGEATAMIEAQLAKG